MTQTENIEDRREPDEALGISQQLLQLLRTVQDVDEELRGPLTQFLEHLAEVPEAEQAAQWRRFNEAVDQL